jgi:anti-sigma-K factor RskA
VKAEQPDCPQTAQVVGWAMHALEPSDEQAFSEHVARCAECAAAVEEVRDLMVALAAASEQGDPPARLRTSLMDAVRATPQDPQTPRPPAPAEPRAEPAAGAPAPPAAGPPRPGARPATADTRPTRSLGAGRWAASGARKWRRAALAVAAVAVVVLGGGLVARQAQAPATAGVQAERGEQTRELLAQVDRPGATHAILSTPDGQPMAAVMNLDGRLNVVAAPGMPANEPATVYVLWGTAPGGPVALGSFAVGPGGSGPTPVGTSGSSAFAGYAVSVEPAGPLPRTPTRVVASGAVAS